MAKITFPAISRAARPHCAALLVFLLIWAVIFAETLGAMVNIWLRSDTFAHGILIFPISLYLIWRKRQLIAQTPLKPSHRALPLLLGLIIVWYLANAVAVNVVSQLAVVLMLPILVWLSCGWQILKLLRFPLFYLLFAVPMGENLVPWLQIITADITVFALQLTNIPVYREGLYLSTPTGLFLVAEACSGIRYLIASIALGSLYAYLTYTSRTKQLLFCIAAIIVPIVANGIRAYGIVLIASLTDMKHAVGVDHLIYGWLFFGIIIFIMFYIGGFFADKPLAESTDKQAFVTKMPATLFTGGLIILLLPLFIQLIIPPLSEQPRFDISHLKTTLTPVTESVAQPQFTDSSVQLAGVWQREQHDILFYAVFYQHTDNKKLVSWHNQPYQTDYWTPADNQSRQISVDDAYFSLQEADLRAANGQKRLLWYWYGSGDFLSADPYLITAMQAIGKVLHISQHGSFYALSVYYENDIDQARALLENELKQRFAQIAAANSAEPVKINVAQQP